MAAQLLLDLVNTKLSLDPNRFYVVDEKSNVKFAYLVAPTTIKPRLWSKHLSLQNPPTKSRPSKSNPAVKPVLIGPDLQCCMGNLDLIYWQDIQVFKIPLTLLGDDLGLLYEPLGSFVLSDVICPELFESLATLNGSQSPYTAQVTQEIEDVLKPLKLSAEYWNVSEKKNIKFLYENRRAMNPVISAGVNAIMSGASNPRFPLPYLCMLMPIAKLENLINSPTPRVSLSESLTKTLYGF